MPKLVYLDSSDFSNLSAREAELSTENIAILSTLRQHKQAGTAKFFMSAIHLSEAVHAAREHKEAAVRRAKLMRELCENNVLRFPTELARLELRKALQFERSARLSVEEITSKNGEWFGFDSSLKTLSDSRQDLDRKINDLIEALPRRERRKRRSELDLKKHSSHAQWRKLLQAETTPTISEFPLSLLSQERVIAWFLREISDRDFRESILQIMRDPYLMFAYFLDETKNRETLYKILRKEGREAAHNLERSTEALIPTLEAISNSNKAIDLTALMKDSCSEPEFLRRYITTYADVSADHITDSETAKIIESCPSLFAFVEVGKAYLLSSATAHLARIRSGNTSVKKIKPSDFGDLMHCFYAPYFDVFRCDGSFGAILKHHKPVRSHVADRISAVLPMLAECTTNNRTDVA